MFNHELLPYIFIVSLRYWDLYENKFIRFFKGHVGAVTSLDVHTYEDLFLSSSIDKTSLLWDLRKEKPIARIPARGIPASAFDSQGLVFGVAAGDQKVHLFDSRNFDKGEFTFFDLSKHLPDPAANIIRIDFSPCGKFIIVVADSGQMFSIDSFKGQLVGAYMSEGSAHASPSFSPDSQYVLCGSASGSINVFRALGDQDNPRRQCQIVTKLEGHSGFPRNVLFNPTRCMVASSCVNTALWIPRQV
jgi:COMPASS component SWD2